MYHGHYRQQTLDGFYGVLIVEPSPGAPLASPYTEEWVWPMQDWYDTNSLPLAAAYAASASGNEPRPDATAVDGRLQALTQPVRGAAAVVLLRLAVPGGFSPFNFSVDGLPLTVVALDGVSVAPFDVPWLIVDVGQRADLRLNFSRLDPGLAAAGGGGGAVYFYVKRLPFMQAFFQSLGTPLGPDFCGVLTFDGSAPRYARGAWSPPPPSAAPGGWPAAPLEANLLGLASPLDAAAWPLPAATHRLNASFTFAALGRNGSTPGGAINRGFISFGGGPLRTFVPPTAAVLKQPLLFKYLAPGGAPYPFQAAAPAAGAFAAAGAARALAADANGDVLLPHGAVVDLTLFNWDSAPHPFHLHGRKLWLLATSGASPITAPGEGDPAAAYAAFVEPTDDPAVAAAGATGVLVRDVFTVPTGPPDGPGSGPPGWARVRFVADRPGVWFFHCARPLRLRRPVFAPALDLSLSLVLQSSD